MVCSSVKSHSIYMIHDDPHPILDGLHNSFTYSIVFRNLERRNDHGQSGAMNYAAAFGIYHINRQDDNG